MITPNFARPTIITDGLVGKDKPSFWNNRLEPVYDFIESLENGTAVIVSSPTYTIPNNTVRYIFVDASANNVVITAPDPAVRTQPFTVKKIDSVIPSGASPTAGLVTITRASASHVLEDDQVRVTGASSSSYTIRIPNQTATWLKISSTTFRMVDGLKPKVYAYLRKNSAQSFTNSIMNKIDFSSGSDTENDPFDLFDKTTSIFTLPFAATWRFTANMSSFVPVNANMELALATVALGDVDRFAVTAGNNIGSSVTTMGTIYHSSTAGQQLVLRARNYNSLDNIAHQLTTCGLELIY